MIGELVWLKIRDYDEVTAALLSEPGNSLRD